MKRSIVLAALVFGLVFTVSAFAQSNKPKTLYMEIFPITSTYTAETDPEKVEPYRRADVSKKNTLMGFSGTSPCQVIDLHMYDIGGSFTFQFKSLTGATSAPLSGTTVSFRFKMSDVDSDAAWVAAPQNTVVDGIDALTGATNVGFDVNDIAGVTRFRYMRSEFESGIANDGSSNNLVPIGILTVR